VQSHLSESVNECEWVKGLHPDCENYAAVYDKYGLLHSRSYMAHCVHCCGAERELLASSGTGVIHCPNSNFSLSSGILNVRRMLAEGIKVGLGTDVSGGYSCSMLDAMRQAITASKMVAIGKGDAMGGGSTAVEPLSFSDVFHLATVGGAQCLGIEDKIGNFVAGKEFDALIVDPSVEGGPFDLGEDDSALDVFQRFIFTGDDRNIERVYVRGKRVK